MIDFIKDIEWSVKQNGPIETFFGKVDGMLMFEIYQFKNEMFTDPYIMTTKQFSSEMLKSDDVEELKETASKILEEYVKRLLT